MSDLFAPGPVGLYSHLGEVSAQLWANPLAQLQAMAGTPLEWVALLVTLASVVLAGRQNIWSWHIGLIGVVLYGYLFWQVYLFSDMVLQAYFFITQFYGWWLWASVAQQHGMAGNLGQVHLKLLQQGLAFWRQPTVQAPEVTVATLAPITAALGLCGIIMVAALIAWPMRSVGAALPFWDSLILTASVVAQLLLARKVVQSWWLWVFVNLIAIGVYSTKGLYPTTVLYGFFLINAIFWGIRWQRLHHKQTAGQSVGPVVTTHA